MFKKLLGALLCALFISNATAQHKSHITVLAKAKQDGIWIRWAPVDPTVWLLGNRHGYIVERFTLLSNGELESPTGANLTPSPLKPYTLAELNKLTTTIEEADVLAELIYDEDVNQPVRSNDPYSLLARNQDLENKYGIALLVCDLSVEVARAAALFISDNTAVKGKRYIYRVSLAEQPPGQTIEPGVVVVDAADEKPLQALDDLKADFRDKTVSLSWSTLLHHGLYSGYFIEKSEDGKNFKRLSELPYFHLSDSPETETAFFVDSLEVNYKTSYYQVMGISPFGEVGPPSNVVSGKGKDDLSGQVVIREGRVQDNNIIHLAWEFPKETEDRITGFKVSKSRSAGGPYEDITSTLLNKDKRSHETVESFNNTYFVVSAVDESGEEVSRSFPFLVHREDAIPPVMPSGLNGSIDKKGIVQLNWLEGKDDDLMGYRVFRSNSMKEEFIEITKKLLAGPSFSDTIAIKVLNRKIFYRVVAVDNNFNNSAFSDVLTLDKPDIVPPVAAVFTKAEIDKSNIVLVWTNSTSADITKVELIRNDSEDQVPRMLKTWKSPMLATEHRETSLVPGRTYRYKLIVYDSAGNVTESNSPQLYFETGFRNAPTDIKAIVDRDNREIKFQWKNQSQVAKCLVYRQRGDEPIRLYKTIEGNVDSFTDKNITINSKYKYKFQVVYSKGIRSQLSEEIPVIF